MSREIHILKILERVSKLISSDENQIMAAALKVSPPTCSNWKDRNTIPWKHLFEFAKERQISFDWLLTGEYITPRCPVQCDEDLIELCKRVKKVMESKDGFSRALEANVYAFEESVNLKREVANLKTSMGQNGGTPYPAKLTARKRKVG